MYTKLIYAIFSLISGVIVPIILLIAIKKKSRMSVVFKMTIIGIVIDFLARDVLLKLAATLLGASGLSGFWMNTAFRSAFTIGLTSLMVFGLLMLVRKKILSTTPDSAELYSLALGMIISESILNFIMPSISNLIYLIQSSRGEFVHMLTGTLGTASALEVEAMYASLPSSYYLFIGLMALFTILSSMISVLLLGKTQSAGGKLALLGWLILSAIISYFVDPIQSSLANPVVIVLILSGFLLLMNLMRKRKVMEGPVHCYG